MSTTAVERGYDAKYRAAHPEKISAKNKRYYAQHPDKSKERYEKWKLAHPEKAKARYKIYRGNNLEKTKAAVAKWEAEHPEDRRIRNQNRKARKNSNGGRLSRGIAGKLFVLQKGKCACCSRPLGDNYQLDHILPMALGGANEDRNIQLLRGKCNQQKHAKHPVDFMQERGFLL